MEVAPQEPRFSYRDVLARQAPPQPVKAAVSTVEVSIKREWQPKLSVATIPRIRQDRLYGAQSQRDVNELDMDDDGMWGLIDAHVGTKHAAAACHRRTVTMLTPLQQEKKDSRIALKAHI